MVPWFWAGNRNLTYSGQNPTDTPRWFRRSDAQRGTSVFSWGNLEGPTRITRFDGRLGLHVLPDSELRKGREVTPVLPSA